MSVHLFSRIGHSPFVCLFGSSIIHSFVRSSACPFVRSFVRSFVHSCLCMSGRSVWLYMIHIPYGLHNRLFFCSSVQLHIYYMHSFVHLSIRSYILMYFFERPFVHLVLICSAVSPFVSSIVYAGVILSTVRSFVRSFVCVRLFVLNRSSVQSYNYIFIIFGSFVHLFNS